MRKLILITCIILASSYITRSQDTLGLGANGTIFNITTFTTTTYSSIDSVHVFIKNKGSNTFAGTLSVTTAVDSGSGGLNQYMIDTMSVSSLLPGDSIKFDINILYTPSHFRIGTNIVVIWPSVAGAFIADSSIKTTVTIIGTSSVIEIDKNGKLHVYPNPANDYLYLKAEFQQTNIRQLSLFDVQGRLVDKFNGNIPLIHLNNYPTGSYLLQVEFSDNTIRHYKIIKQ